MNRFLILSIISFFLASLTVLSLSLPQVMAQEDEGEQITISPPVADIQIDESYTLLIENNYEKSITLSLEPALFQLDTIEQSFEFIESSDTNYLVLSKSQVTIAADSTAGVTVSFTVETPPNTVPGIIIRQSTESQEGVSTTFQAASLVYSSVLGESTIEEISTGIQLVPRFRLFNIAFGTDIRTFSFIENRSDKIITPESASIELSSDNEFIEAESITQNLPSSIWPSDSFERDETITLDISFWLPKKVDATQTTVVNGVEFTDGTTLWIIPLWYLFVLIALVLGSIGGFTFYKWMNLKKKTIKNNRYEFAR